MTTRRCSKSGPSGTVTWAGCAPRSPAGCTRCSGLVPGVRKEITAAHAARILEAAEPAGAVAMVRRELASDFTEGPAPHRCPDEPDEEEASRRGQGIRHDAHRGVRRGTRHRRHRPGRGVRDVSRIPAGTVSRPVTGPPRSRSPPATARCTGCRAAGTGGSTTRSTWPPSPRSGTSTGGPRVLRQETREGKTSEEALRALKRRISDALYRRLRAGASRAATGYTQVTSPGGQAGNGTDASAAGSHPEHQLFGTATPGT
jgi:hypothetical protein